MAYPLTKVFLTQFGTVSGSTYLKQACADDAELCGQFALLKADAGAGCACTGSDLEAPQADVLALRSLL
ncbi:MAG: hypothetical protein IPK83_11115 [Planctomycetes bacterium]|nr:hypothetical protein [Planctomycetota bacterium]